jgi:hypothetical protein
MATYDTNRTTFVQQEYRYITKSVPAIKSRNDGAREIEIYTNLDATAASDLAAKYLADNVAPRAFEITLEGVVFLDSFIGGPPSFVPNFPKYATDGRAMKVFSYSTDIESNTTVIQVRG